MLVRGLKVLNLVTSGKQTCQKVRLISYLQCFGDFLLEKNGITHMHYHEKQQGDYILKSA